MEGQQRHDGSRERYNESKKRRLTLYRILARLVITRGHGKRTGFAFSHISNKSCTLGELSNHCFRNTSLSSWGVIDVSCGCTVSWLRILVRARNYLENDRTANQINWPCVKTWRSWERKAECKSVVTSNRGRCVGIWRSSWVALAGTSLAGSESEFCRDLLNIARIFPVII